MPPVRRRGPRTPHGRGGRAGPFVLLLAVAATLVAGPASAAQLAERVEALRQSAGVPYVDLAVIRSDGPCTFTRYSEPVPRIHAAGVSSLLTATVVLQLEAEGVLDLDDRLARWLPAFRRSRITLRHLLTHTSGLHDSDEPAGRRDPAQVERYFARLARQRPMWTPGAVWSPAAANFNLLGRVLESALDAPFPALMRERLLEPLSMRDSTFLLDDVPEAARVEGWVSRLGRLWAEPTPWDLAFAPSSGLQTTAADLARFLRALLLANEGMNDPTVPLSVVAHFRDDRVDIPRSDVRQGLGWRIDETPLGPRWYHTASEAGREGVVTLYPEQGFGVVAFGNLEGWPRFEFEAELAGAVGSDAACRLWF